MKYLNVGDKVRVLVPQKDCSDNPMLARFHGKTLRIARRQPIGANRVPYYELDGAVSEKGTPYGFVREWIREA